MNGWYRNLLVLTTLGILLFGFAPGVRADEIPPDPLVEVNFEQKLNAQVPPDLKFRDDKSRNVQIGNYLGEKPLVLFFAYYDCPMLCNLVLQDFTKTLKDLNLVIGEHFQVVTISIDPGDTPELAAEKKAALLQEFGQPEAAQSWHFLTGEQTQIDRLADSVGFRYVYDAELDQYAHPAGILVLTPEGRVSRYFFGIEYSSKDVRLGIIEASKEHIGTPVDQFFLLCYAYNPETGRYTLLISNVIRLTGTATVLFLAGMITYFLARERRERKEQADGAQPDLEVEQHG